MGQRLHFQPIGKRLFTGQDMFPVEVAVHQGNGGGIPVKGADQHGNFCQTCLPGSIQASVAADDFVLVFFRWSDNQR